jgi:uncharacterized protein YqeY
MFDFSQDLKRAQLAKDDLKVSVLRLLLSNLNNRQIEKRTGLSQNQPLEKLDDLSRLTEEEILEVLAAEAKRRKESITAFDRGGRKDLADKEKKELEIIAGYLPAPLSETEIKNLIEQTIAQTAAQNPSDLGRVMNKLMPQTRGRADNALVSRLVKEILAPK